MSRKKKDRPRKILVPLIHPEELKDPLKTEEAKLLILDIYGDIKDRMLYLEGKIDVEEIEVFRDLLTESEDYFLEEYGYKEEDDSEEIR